MVNETYRHGENPVLLQLSSILRPSATLTEVLQSSQTNWMIHDGFNLSIMELIVIVCVCVCLWGGGKGELNC